MKFAVLQERVAGTIIRYSMLSSGARIGIAVSGGADSICLLHILHELGRRFGVSLHVLHLNHSLRGAESDEDEQHVLALAQSLGLPATSARWRHEGSSQNLEQAAREARLAFFRHSMQELDLQRVATGHTLSDQAETVLFRMLRGTANAGLAAIRPVTCEGIVRPLIEINRHDVREWLSSHGIPWREDSTNLDPGFARNRIRQEVMPLLASVCNPAAEEALARLATLASDDEEYWDQLVQTELSGMAIGKPPFIVDARALTAHHPALARRLIRKLLSLAAGSTRRFTQQHIESVWDLARQSRGSGRLILPKASVERSFQLLRFTPACVQPATPQRAALHGPGTVTIFGKRLEVFEEKRFGPHETVSAECRYNEGGELLDADRVVFPFLVRSWSPGDAYQPHGFASEVRLKDLFGSARIPSWDRHEWPIIESGERIVWCRRFGSASWAAVDAATRRQLHVRELND